MEAPDSADDVYLGRSGDTQPYRPILTGDIYSGIAIPGVGIEHDLAVLVSHPCNMRSAGGQLRDRVQMCPVTAHQRIPFENWPDGYFGVFPLPEFDTEGLEHAAGHFDEIGMVATTQLTADCRVSYLTERGILFLLQRSIYRSSRVDVTLDTLGRACRHVLAEADLLEEWNERLLPLREGQGVGLVEALGLEAAEFDAYLSEATDYGSSRRDQLRDPHRQSQVRKEVRAEMVRRAS